MRHLSITILSLILSFCSYGQIAPITGSLNACPGGISTLASATPGGTWSSSSTTIVTVGMTTGLATAVSTGVATITYTVGSSAVTALFTVHATPASITGTPMMCVGGTVALSCATPGGTWTSATTPVATISSGGVVTGISPGTSFIFYTVGTCSSVVPATVNPIPTSITGSLSVCVGDTTMLSCTPGGGAWSSSMTSIATVSTGGVVVGLSAGASAITYALGTGCATISIATVHALPAITASASSACGGVYTLTATGGTYYSWSPSTGLSCGTCSTTTIDPTTTTALTVMGTSSVGCSGTASVTVNGNRIRGHVSHSGSGSVKVWLVKFNHSDSSILALDSTMTCVTGGGGNYYEFASPAAGNYRVKAYLLGGTPGTSGYIPTYGTTTPNWFSADTIVHTTNTDTMHVGLIYGTVPSGTGFISGYVVSGAGKGTAGEVPEPGMLVYLKDGMGNIVTYTYTDVSGAYTFGSLGYGTYYVYPEEYKYYTTPSSALILTSTTPSAPAVSFKKRTTYGTIVPFVVTAADPLATETGLSVYPNPMKDVFSVEGITGDTHYRILNVTGACMGNGVMQQGSHTISAAHIATGVYILELTNERAERSMIKVVKE